MTLTQSIITGTRWMATSNVCVRILNFAFGIVLARLLVPADFGAVATIQILTGIAALFASAGLAQAVVQAEEIEPRHLQVVFTTQLGIGIAVFVLFYAISESFASWFGNPGYAALLIVSSISFLIRPFGNTAAAILQRKMNFKPLVILQLIVLVFGASISIALALLDYGPWSLVLGTLAGAVVHAVGLLAITRWSPRFVFDLNALRPLAAFGAKFTVNNVIRHAKSQVQPLLIAKLAGAEFLGLYNKGLSLSQMPFEVLGGSLYQPAFRGLAKIQTDLQETKRLYLRMVAILAIYTPPLGVFLFWTADPLIPFIYGEHWRGAIEPLSILAFCTLFMLGNPSGALIAAQNRVGKEIPITLETGLILAALTYVAIPYGIEVVAGAFLVAFIYGNIRLFRLVKLIIGVTFTELMKTICSGWLVSATIFVGIGGTSYLLPATLRTDAPHLYLLAIGGAWIASFVACLALVPTQDVKLEKKRLSEVAMRFIHRRELSRAA